MRHDRGLFIADAGECLRFVEHFARYWRVEDAPLRDRSIAAGLLQRAASECEKVAKRYSAAAMIETVEVEAQDIGEGDVIYFRSSDQTFTVASVSSDLPAGYDAGDGDLVIDFVEWGKGTGIVTTKDETFAVVL